MKLCDCANPNCDGTGPNCHPLRKKANETLHEAFFREGAEKRAANPTDDWRARTVKPQQVGCEGADGLLRIHSPTDTCDVCGPTSTSLNGRANDV